MLNEEEYQEELSAQKKRKGCLTAIIIMIAILGLMLYGFRKIMIPVNETSFTPHRIAELEKEYHIDLSNAEPIRYWHVAVAQDTKDQFSFYTEDYRKFMEQHYFGEICIAPENVQTAPVQYKCAPWPDSEDRLEQRFRFVIKFEQQKEKYYAEIISYYE
ncbi:MAG: hypothetical protein E7496_02130 [Ruminococcus sp.]|nr:hypothetical protein [Ruminococcus sp.]